MSAVPQRTQILVKDLIFQSKYNLSHTQTDLMAYLVNVTYWAISVDGYYVIATKKVMSDLPQLGEKTFEASLKVLKELRLVECKIVEVLEWRGKPKLRGIRLTEKGKEYNAKLMLPNQDKILKKMKKELDEALKKLSISEKKEETKETTTSTETTPPTPKLPKKEKIDDFIEQSRQYFGSTSRPICNLVPTYNQDTTFYINSYNRLSIITPQNEFKQITNPKAISEFWQWLYLHPQRVGDKIDFTKTPTLKELNNRYTNRAIKIGEERYTIVAFVQEDSGVKVKVREESGAERFLIDSSTDKDMVMELGYCEEIVLRVLG